MAVACLAMAVAVAPTTEAAESDEIAQARQRLLAEREDAAGQLGQAEATLSEAVQTVTDTTATLAERTQTRVQVRRDLRQAREDREVPLEIRRAIAIQSYVAGDPNSNSLINELIDGSSSLDGVRDRALYSSVVDWATDNLDRLDAEIARLSAELEQLEDEIPTLTAELAEAEASVEAARTARDGLVARIAALDEDIRNLNRAILTGLTVDRVETRPILVVKIDNVSGARPQQGIDVADIVIEEKVESGLTRLAALFQSTGSDPVGPIRSARTSDVHLLANLGSPLFAYSGANAGVGASVFGSTLVDVGASTNNSLYYRESSRRAPHNLYSNTSRLWGAVGDGSPPRSLFTFRSDGDPIGAGARAAQGVDVTYGSARASFTWDAGLGGWARSQDGRPHTVAGGAQIAPANVVVRFTDYVPSPADARSPEAVVTGSGELWVLTDGQVVVGRWEQPSLTAPTRWLDANGDPIRLTPGRTWILLPSPGDATLR
ncbi:MAG: DUF3048 domain-containing protein [Acidimicrobiales bacterium]